MFRAGCWVFLCMLILNTGCTICMDKTYDSRQVQSVNGGCLLLVDTWSHLQYTPGFLFVFSWFSFFYRICPIDHYELSSLVLQPEKKHTVADIMLNHLQIGIYFKIQNTDYDTLPAPKKDVPSFVIRSFEDVQNYCRCMYSYILEKFCLG